MLVEQKPPQGVFICDYAGLVSNTILLFLVVSTSGPATFQVQTLPSSVDFPVHTMHDPVNTPTRGGVSRRLLSRFPDRLSLEMISVFFKISPGK